MKKLLVVMALLVMASVAMAQILGEKTYIYRGNKMTKNTYDTIPNIANTAGSNGWIYIGNANVSVGFSGMDSINAAIDWVEYADSASGPVAGMAKVYQHVGRARSVGEDSIFTKTALTTGNSAFCGKVYRDHAGGVDLIPGGQWIRFIIHAENTDEQALAAAKGYIYRFTVRTWQGN
jgi:hypothetical protein